ncbi:MAG: carboxypeptidase regulatory-like domain-containing protein [Luteitalea sp.]|nr:carboxypeptidase regulatory-like domain-containing protein [Luteitalea sp.]
MKRILGLTVVISFLCTSLVHGQTSAQLVGTVTDPSGAVIPGAQVTVTEEATGFTRTAITNDTGRYTVPALRPSRYALSVEMPGFTKYVEHTTLLQDQVLTVNVRLEVVEARETVTVLGPGSTVSPDTQTPTIGQVIENERVEDLPLNGRNAATLTLLTAGTFSAPSRGADQGLTKTFPGAVTISSNGARQNQMSYMLDGGIHSDRMTNVNQRFPFPDAVQEFSVQTSNYSAEYGQNAGGVVNVATKAGTNDLHGTLFGFHRNEALNARNFFSPETDPLKRTQFGGVGGGPIIENKTFFFGGFQGTRVRSIDTGLSAFVPTIRNREGDFSALLDANDPANPVGRVVEVIDPVTGQPFPNNQIPVERFDPAAVNFMELLPSVGGNGRVQFDRPIAQDTDEFVARVDHHIDDNNQLRIRSITNDFDDASAFDGHNLLTLSGASNILNTNQLVGWNHIVSPNVINELTVSFSRTRSHRGQPNTVPLITDFGVNIDQPPSFEGGIRQVNASGFFNVGAFLPARFIRQSWSIKSDLTWVRGRHTLSIGGDFEHSSYNLRNEDKKGGGFFFTNDVTNFALASLVLGDLRRFEQGSDQDVDTRANFFSLYMQDTFQAHPRLTLSVGVRWEPGSLWNDVRGRVEQFRIQDFLEGNSSPQFDNAPPGLFFAGDPGVPKKGQDDDYVNLAPRLGIAWDVTGQAKTVVRGGVGAFYDARTNAFNNTFVGSLPPFSTFTTFTDPEGPFSDPLRGTNFSPLDFTFPAPQDFVFPEPLLVSMWDANQNFETPVAYNWNLTLEHQLRPSWMARIGYVGSRTEHLLTAVELNPASFVPGSTLGTDARRPFAGFGSIQETRQDVQAEFHSLQLGVEKRPFSGDPVLLNRLTVLANYTFSKSIDTSPFGFTISNANNNGSSSGGGRSPISITEPNPFALDRGPSEFDRTHRVVVSYIFRFPDLEDSSHWFSRHVLGGWRTTGIFQAQSGTPLTILAGQDTNQNGLNNDRGLFLGGSDELGTGSRGSGGCGAGEEFCVDFLDPDRFAVPPAGSPGNIGKGAFRGPNFWNFDMAFLKTFYATEALRAELRGELFNIFNHANFADPNTSVTAAGFGGIRSASDPRIVQVGLKIISSRMLACFRETVLSFVQYV